MSNGNVPVAATLFRGFKKKEREKFIGFDEKLNDKFTVVYK